MKEQPIITTHNPIFRYKSKESMFDYILIIGHEHICITFPYIGITNTYQKSICHIKIKKRHCTSMKKFHRIRKKRHIEIYDGKTIPSCLMAHDVDAETGISLLHFLLAFSKDILDEG